MEFHITWPSWWQNIAFAIACVVFILVSISENDKSKRETGKIVSSILLNKYLWTGLCLLSFLAGFTFTLYSLQYGIDDETKAIIDIGMLECMFAIIGIIIPAIIVAFALENRASFLGGGFIFAAGNAFIGLIFLLCNAFSYMWVALGFFIFDILGAFVTNYIDER